MTGGTDLRQRHRGGRRLAATLLRHAAALAVIGGAVAYLRAVAPWAEVTEILDGVPAATVAVIGAAAAVNIGTYWLVMAAALPGLRLRHAAAAHLPATACSNVLPAGGAIGTATSVSILRRLGYGGDQIVTSMIVTGLWNTFAKLAVPVVAVVAASTTGDVAAGDLLIAASAGTALAVGAHTTLRVLRHETVARRIGSLAEHARARVLRRQERADQPWARAAVRLHERAADTVRSRSTRLTLSTVTSHATLFIVFVLAVRGAGLSSAHISTVELLGAFALARVATLVPLTPGGLGVIEVTLTTALDASGGPPDRAVAAVLLYRGATYALPTMLGAIVAAVWAMRRTHRPLPGVGIDARDLGIPLVVDLDGTLLPVTTRTLMAARLAWADRAALRDYLRLHRSDRLASKLYLCERAALDVDQVPIRRDVLRWLQDQHDLGRPLYLASGAPQEVVDQIAARYPMFSGAWGSTPTQHLVGPAKAAALVAEFGSGGYDYIGDAAEDLHVWAASRHAILCAPRRRVRRAAHDTATVSQVFSRTLGDTVFAPPRVLHAALRQRPGPRPTRQPQKAPPDPPGQGRDLAAARVGAGVVSPR